MRKRNLTDSLITSLTLIIASLHASAAEDHLKSYRTDETIILDGTADEVWKSAKVLSVKVDKLPYQPDKYPGIKETTVKLRSLYDDQFVYFLVEYGDPTKSLLRYPWQKQPDGSWKQLKDKDQIGHENIYYEDKFAFFWEIYAPGFDEQGCALACHLINDKGKIGRIDQKGITAGRKFTRRRGQTIDMWHWKSVRMNPVGLMDDQFVNHVKNPRTNKNWGRHSDDKTGGNYVTNINLDRTGPAYMNRSQDGLNDYTITPSQKTALIDNFKAGDLVPGIVSTPFTGSRADIWSRGVWKEGQWTIEIKRKLVTKGRNTKTQDVQFSEPDKTYYFGVAVFDNSQINHIYHDGVLKFTFLEANER